MIKKYDFKFKIILLFMFFLTIIFSIKNNKIFANDSNEVDYIEEINNYDTYSLIEYILEEELYYVFLFSDTNIGIQKFKENNEYYKNLISRNDIIESFNNILSNDNINNYEREKIEFLYAIYSENNIMETANGYEITEYYNHEIYTPNGSIVQYATYSEDDLTNEDIYECYQFVFDEYPTLTEDDYIYPANNAYNCHSYAWYEQDPSQNNYWIRYPTSYINDYSYMEVSDVKPGDILCYFSNDPTHVEGEFISHSAIVVYAYNDFNVTDINTLDRVELISKWGIAGVYTHTGNECPYGTDDQYFICVKAYRPRTNASYTLMKYNLDINEQLIISNNSSILDTYEMYELNVTDTKNYEFEISSTQQLDVRLYDEHMQLINIDDLDANEDNFHFIENLIEDKMYYLRVAFKESLHFGTINTLIISNRTIHLQYGRNELPINLYDTINEYTFFSSESGFYELKFIGNTSDGKPITYQDGCIRIYEDNDREIYTDKYQLDDYTYNATSIESRLLVYLSSNKYYYLELNLSKLEYSSLYLSITKEEEIEYDYSDNLAFGMFDELFNTNQKDDYFKKISISHRSLFILDALSLDDFPEDDSSSEEIKKSIRVAVLQEKYNSSLKQNYLKEIIIIDENENDNENDDDTKKIPEITEINSSPQFIFILEPGTYYFGYIGNIYSITIKYALERVIDTSVDIYNTLVADPNNIGYDLGSEVRYNNGLCDNYTITEGFTRNMYVMVEDRETQSISRLDYDWYSSNEDIAIVTSYGTVLAKNVASEVEVKIYAMLKEDPSIVYEKTFTIINDESLTPIEITSNMSYSHSELNGEYKLELNTNNSIFPYIQYYTWEIEENELNVNMDNWGFISSNGTGTVVIIGSYIYNPRVTIIINLTILE